MKTKSILGFVGIAAAVCATSAFAGEVTTSGFGAIPGVTGTTGAYGNVDNTMSVYSVTTGIGGSPLGGDQQGLPSDTLTLAEEATGYGAFNSPLVNNGAGTYSAATGFGTPPTRSTFDWDFYANSANGLLNQYVFTLTLDNLGNGKTLTFDPHTIPDNVPGDNSSLFSFGNAESFDFGVFGNPISYNALLNDTYTETLSASLNGQLVASDEITIVAGTGAVAAPDGGSTLTLAGIGLGALALLRRRFAGC